MGSGLKRVVLTAVAVGTVWPAAALGAPVDVTQFSLSPTYTHPGGTVTSTVGVRNTTLVPQTFYGQSRASYFGHPVQTSQVFGPVQILPFVSGSTSMQNTVPWYAPWGSYTITVGIGPSAADPMGWSTASAPLTVVPWC